VEQTEDMSVSSDSPDVVEALSSSSSEGSGLKVVVNMFLSPCIVGDASELFQLSDIVLW
jgi:hypothetical protein